MIKRIFDMSMSGLLCLIIFPFIFPIMLLLRITGEGHIFFIQKRVGLNGKEFSLLKLATMLKNSPNIGTGNLTIKDDPRILPFGKILRKSKINELPQLLNVLMGDMSFVGPRPLTSDHFESIPEKYKKEIKKLKPGITGIGSIVFRDEEDFKSKDGKNDVINYYKAEIIPYKASLELWYYSNQSFFVDTMIIVLTIITVFFSNNFHSIFFKDIPKHSIFNS